MKSLLTLLLLSPLAFAEDKIFLSCDCIQETHRYVSLPYYKGECKGENIKSISQIVDKKNKKMNGRFGAMEDYSETETTFKTVLLNSEEVADIPYGEFTASLNRVTLALQHFDNYDENHRGIISETSSRFHSYEYQCLLVDRL
jgi:hypothetical protein